jgi:hypothetical protein
VTHPQVMDELFFCIILKVLLDTNFIPKTVYKEIEFEFPSPTLKISFV